MAKSQATWLLRKLQLLFNQSGAAFMMMRKTALFLATGLAALSTVNFTNANAMTSASNAVSEIEDYSIVANISQGQDTMVLG